MKKIAVVLLVFFCGYAHAQVDKKKFATADGYFLDSNYAAALPLFLDLIQYDTVNANLNFKVGVCYLNMPQNKIKGLRFLKNAVKNVSEKSESSSPKETAAPIEAFKYLGDEQLLNYDFSNAQNAYERFLSYVDESSTDEIAEIKHLEDYCFNGIELMKKPVVFKIINLGANINSPYSDYAPMISADEGVLVYTSRRPENVGGKKDPSNNDYFEDIYITNRSDSTWNPGQNIGMQINTPGHEGTIGISNDGQTILMYKDDNGDGNIYQTSLIGEVWSPPIKLPETINSKSWEPSASMNGDGTLIYFVSDRKGGFGGRDIYRVSKLPNGTWSEAQNLGPTINTPYDEESPFIHPDGVTLFFCSKGHKSMGGFDIFYSRLNEENKWGEPANIGYPINTPDDDLYYTLSADGMHAYYSTIKKDGFGDKDIYMISYDTTVVESIVLIKGQITTDEGLNLPPDAKITITDELGNLIQEIKPNISTGKYLATLNPGKGKKTYYLNYLAPGYKSVKERIDLSADNSYQVIDEAVDLKKINLQGLGPEMISYSGIVTDLADGQPIKGAVVVVTNLSTGKTICDTLCNETTGAYNIMLEKGKDFSIVYAAAGYLFKTENLQIGKETTGGGIKKDEQLEKIKSGVKVVLKNIFFDNAKATLRKESETELQNLFAFLRDNPSVKIEVSGHTDTKGNSSTNLTLSKQRAESVVNYLVKNGIDKSRLVAKGYGQTQPIAPNTKPNGKPDPDGMQLNRRVEMKIID